MSRGSVIWPNTSRVSPLIPLRVQGDLFKLRGIPRRLQVDQVTTLTGQPVSTNTLTVVPVTLAKKVGMLFVGLTKSLVTLTVAIRDGCEVGCAGGSRGGVAGGVPGLPGELPGVELMLSKIVLISRKEVAFEGGEFMVWGF